MSYHVDRTLKYMGSAVQQYQLSEAGCEAFDYVSLMSFFFPRLCLLALLAISRTNMQYLTYLVKSGALMSGCSELLEKM